MRDFENQKGEEAVHAERNSHDKSGMEATY